MRVASCFSLLILITGVACGPGSPGGPANSRMSARQTHPLQSNSILERKPQTERAVVKHVLVGWKDLEGVYGDRMDPRAKKRSRWDAEKLTKKLFKRVKDGEAIEALMAEHSEDQGSAATGRPYEVVPDAQFVPEFKELSLRLKVGEAGKVLTQFGWHIILRVE